MSQFNPIEVEHRNYSEKPFGILGQAYLCKLEWVLSDGSTISEETTCRNTKGAYDTLSETLQKRLDEKNAAAQSEYAQEIIITKGAYNEIIKRIEELEKKVKELENRPLTIPSTPEPGTIPYPNTPWPWQPYTPWDPCTPTSPSTPYPYSPIIYCTTTTLG